MALGRTLVLLLPDVGFQAVVEIREQKRHWRPKNNLQTESRLKGRHSPVVFVMRNHRWVGATEQRGNLPVAETHPPSVQSQVVVLRRRHGAYKWLMIWLNQPSKLAENEK